MMVTRLVGKLGLGNRPGRADFGSAFLWPYGRREMVLPVWAHRRNVQYDRLVFQDCNEETLGWHEPVSSPEPFYCRPMTPIEMDAPIDAITCPTTAFNTDKGKPLRLVDPTNSRCMALMMMPEKSLYPPRGDLKIVGVHDWPGVRDFHKLDDLDAVSYATPKLQRGQTFKVTYPLPAGLAPGQYTVWVEVNREQDPNAFHNEMFHHDPNLNDYGIEWMGQPSVLYSVPIAIGAVPKTSTALDYAGYGSSDGQDGDLRPPDMTITNDPQKHPGSGVDRLLVVDTSTGSYRVKVAFNTNETCVPPRAVQDLSFVTSDWDKVTLRFTSDSGATSYKTYYAVGKNAIDGSNVLDAIPGPELENPSPGDAQTFTVDGLRDRTRYTIGIRAFNACGEGSDVATFEATTPVRVFTTVGWCFIATAAYGSPEEAHVKTLRAFRDRVLMKTEAGRAFVDLYYAVSPPIADVVREHAILRFAVRKMLDPAVEIVKGIDSEE